MFLTRRGGLKKISDLVYSRKLLSGAMPRNLVVLNSAVEKEFKPLGRHCEVLGLEKDVLVVRAASSVAGHEIFLRKGELIRNINKHFRSKWIKDIKIISRG